MREIDLGSSQLMGVGYFDGDRLLCTSFGVHEPPIPLGPARYINSLGLELRPALRLTISPGRTRVVGVRDGTAVLLASELITDLYPDNSSAPPQARVCRSLECMRGSSLIPPFSAA